MYVLLVGWYAKPRPSWAHHHTRRHEIRSHIYTNTQIPNSTKNTDQTKNENNVAHASAARRNIAIEYHQYSGSLMCTFYAKR